MSAPLRDRMKGSPPAKPVPPPMVTPRAPRPQVERKVGGWVCRVMGPAHGTLTSPEGHVIPVEKSGGVIVFHNIGPLYNAEAGKTLADMMRKP